MFPFKTEQNKTFHTIFNGCIINMVDFMHNIASFIIRKHVAVDLLRNGIGWDIVYPLNIGTLHLQKTIS